MLSLWINFQTLIFTGAVAHFSISSGIALNDIDDCLSNICRSAVAASTYVFVTQSNMTSGLGNWDLCSVTEKLNGFIFHLPQR